YSATEATPPRRRRPILSARSVFVERYMDIILTDGGRNNERTMYFTSETREGEMCGRRRSEMTSADLHPLALQAEFRSVAEIAVGEAIEESETGDAVETRRRGLNPRNSQVLVKRKRGKLDAKIVDRKQACVGTTQTD